MTYLIISILVLTLLIFGLNRFLGKNLACPICAATVLTWAVALAGMYFNWFEVNNLFLAVLIGTSLGASTEKYGHKFGLLWKTLMVVLGAPAIYYLVQNNLAVSMYFLLALLFSTVIMSLQFNTRSSKGAYKDTFKDCCN